jgi:hypothetical protein
MTDIHIMRVDSTEIGYGRMGVMVDRGFRALGYDVSNEIDSEPGGTVLHCSTPAHLLRYRQGQRLILNSMWESATLPESFRESLHLFDLIVVPSQQNVELFGQWHDNVQMVPLGIDPLLWKPTERTIDPHQFRFLIGGSGPRKGPDLAYQAFRNAFPDGSWDGPEPWLVIKSPRHSPFQGERITQINGRLPGEEEVRLYETSHCYLQPSRGEGFGLQPLQAIAQGLPTILTDAHGHASFAHLGIPISATLTPTIPGSFMFGDAGDWWEPSLEELTEQMRWVYDNYTAACATAMVNARIAHREFTWDETVRKMVEVIGPLKPYEGSGEWMTPEIKLYQIVLNRRHGADIAGKSYSWEAFTPYHVPADIKRILFDGGYLDPSCIHGDAGLLPEQVQEAGLLSGAESFCGTCHQRLGSQPTRADLLEIEYNLA